MNLLFQLLVNGVVQGAVYGLLSIGFALIYRNLKIFHIAYGAIYTVAAYSVYFSHIILHLSLGISIINGLISGIAVGLFIESSIYWQFFKKGATSSVILIASLGVAIFFENLIALLFGNEVKIINPGIEPSYRFGSIILTKIQIIQLIIGYIVAIAFVTYLKSSRRGKAIWALGDNPELLEVQGFSLKNLRIEITIMSSFLVSLASILVALDVGVDPHVGMDALLTGAVAAISGGINVRMGWLLGGVILSQIQNLAIWKLSSRWNPLFTFLLLILILIFRPQGILGRSVKE